jgi:hypothetical protein
MKTINNQSKNPVVIQNRIKAGSDIRIIKEYVYDTKKKFKQLNVQINGIAWNKLENITKLFKISDLVGVPYKVDTLTGDNPNCTVFEFIYLLYTKPELFTNLIPDDTMRLYVPIDTFVVRYLMYYTFEQTIGINTSKETIVDPILKTKDNVYLQELIRERKNYILYQKTVLYIQDKIRTLFKKVKQQAFHTVMNMYREVFNNELSVEVTLRLIIHDIFRSRTLEENDRYEDYDYIVDIPRMLYNVLGAENEAEILTVAEDKEIISKYFTVEQETQLKSYITEIITWYGISAYKNVSENDDITQLGLKLFRYFRDTQKSIKDYFVIRYNGSIRIRNVPTKLIRLPRNYFHMEPKGVISNTQYKNILETLNIVMNNIFSDFVSKINIKQ